MPKDPRVFVFDHERSVVFYDACLWRAPRAAGCGPQGCCAAFVRDPDGHRVEAVLHES